MRRLIAAVIATVGFAFGGTVVHDAVSPVAAHAVAPKWSFGGHCGWSTDGAWHWSPYEGRYYRYLYHTPLDGHYWRVYATYAWSGTFIRYELVYCG